MHLKDFPKKEELRARGRWQVCKVNTREEVAWKNKEGKSTRLVRRCGCKEGEFPALEERAGCSRAVFLLIPFKDPSGQCCCLVVKGSMHISPLLSLCPLIVRIRKRESRLFSPGLFCEF